MWYILGITVIVIFIGYWEIPYMLNKGLKREFYLYITILGLGYVFNILIALRIPIPNPNDLIIIVNKPFSDLLANILK